MNIKHLSGYYDEVDADEFSMLGSRFIRAVRENNKAILRKHHRDHELDSKRSWQSRPGTARDRSY